MMRIQQTISFRYFLAVPPNTQNEFSTFFKAIRQEDWYLDKETRKAEISSPHSYRRYWTGASLQVRLMRGVFSNVNDINLFLMLFPPAWAYTASYLMSNNENTNMACWKATLLFQNDSADVCSIIFGYYLLVSMYSKDLTFEALHLKLLLCHSVCSLICGHEIVIILAGPNEQN